MKNKQEIVVVVVFKDESAISPNNLTDLKKYIGHVDVVRIEERDIETNKPIRVLHTLELPPVVNL